MRASATAGGSGQATLCRAGVSRRGIESGPSQAVEAVVVAVHGPVFVRAD